MSARRRSFFLPCDRDHRCNAVTPAIMWCTCCLLCSRCDQRQLNAMIACQCPLARLVTLEVDWSLWRDPNFVGHDVTRSDRLKGNLNSELICFVFFVCMDYLGCYQHLVKIKSTAPLEIYLLGKMVFNTYFTAVCACERGCQIKCHRYISNRMISVCFG